MKVVACYNVKGGVGKSTLAANLAWAAAALSSRRTLLWDLDPQGGAGFLLGVDRVETPRAIGLFKQTDADRSMISKTAFPLLDVLPADPGLLEIDRFLGRLDKKRRLSRLTHSLAEWYDRIIIDCPPVMNALSDQIVRAADAIIVPLTASPLARRALDDVMNDLRRKHGKHGPVLPVFAMYDARRKLHKDARNEEPTWPLVPMASVVERMGLHKLPVGVYAPRSPAADAIQNLWTGIERKLSSL